MTGLWSFGSQSSLSLVSHGIVVLPRLLLSCRGSCRLERPLYKDTLNNASQVGLLDRCGSKEKGSAEPAEFLQHLCQRTECAALQGGWEARRHEEGAYAILDEQFTCPHIRLPMNRPFRIQEAVRVATIEQAAWNNQGDRRWPG